MGVLGIDEIINLQLHLFETSFELHNDRYIHKDVLDKRAGHDENNNNDIGKAKHILLITKVVTLLKSGKLCTSS